jgi:osmotically inducible lipoprotein OsmB
VLHPCETKPDKRADMIRIGRSDMRNLALVLFACLGLASCATQRQTVGTAAGVAAGAVVAGPVGAVVGGAAGAIVTAPRGYRRVYRGPRRAYRRGSYNR